MLWAGRLLQVPVWGLVWSCHREGTLKWRWSVDPIKTTLGWEREELPFTGIFHLGDQGCEVMGAGMVLEVPPCPSPPREEKKNGKSMGNPWEIPGFQCCSQLQCWAWGISVSCRIQGFLWNKEENSFAPARASLRYPVLFSPAAQDSSDSQGKIPSSQAFPASPAAIPCSRGRLFLSCCLLVEL